MYYASNPRPVNNLPSDSGVHYILYKKCLKNASLGAMKKIFPSRERGNGNVH